MTKKNLNPNSALSYLEENSEKALAGDFSTCLSQLSYLGVAERLPKDTPHLCLSPKLVPETNFPGCVEFC